MARISSRRAVRFAVGVLVFAFAPRAFAQSTGDPVAAPPAPQSTAPGTVQPEPIGDGFEHHHGFTFEADAGVFFATSNDQFGNPYARGVSSLGISLLAGYQHL